MAGVSTPGPTGPFDEGNQNFLQEILRALGSASFAVPSSSAGSTGSGALNLDVARQLATYVSTNGKPESNVDPIARIRYEERRP